MGRGEMDLKIIGILVMAALLLLVLLIAGRRMFAQAFG